ncbi:IS30 family transposase [Candidatus Uhrbacteria bacterium]|nr:IS30 family transposase [Candidatus Uhrbacteria bacterium]
MSNELTDWERQRLPYWLRTKMGIRSIARLLRRDHPILSRETRRNGGNRKSYRADAAHRNREQRRYQQRAGKLDQSPELQRYIEEHLRMDWSPEQIAGRLRTHPSPALSGERVSHETIYRHIYERADRSRKLHVHLRTHRPKRQHQGKRRHRNLRIPERISIHQRPEVVAAKQRYGDWESDTMVFRRTPHRPSLSVQYERKSQLTRIHRIADHSARSTEQAIAATIDSLPAWIFRTMTFDNGSEGVCHVELRRRLGMATYFCDPYCSWQKGGVENMNKLLRQYLPRSVDLRTLSEDALEAIQERLNNRPRKSLRYRTPNEIIHEVMHC